VSLCSQSPGQKQKASKKGEKGNTKPPAGKKSSSSKNEDAKKTASNDKPPSAADLGDVQLEGESDDSVPIYDTCDDIRKKLNEHIAKPGVTQAGFARDLSELIQSQKIQADGIRRFLKLKGPRAGGHNPVFYAAYVYFEKLRLKNGKKKSAKREKLEEAWEEKGGFPREGSHNMHLICPAGTHPTIDYLGKLQRKGTPTYGPIGTKRPRKP